MHFQSGALNSITNQNAGTNFQGIGPHQQHFLLSSQGPPQIAFSSVHGCDAYKGNFCAKEDFGTYK